MTWSETFRTSLEAIRGHRLRSLLTTLGILIGIAAVILTVGLGQGAQAQVRAQIDALGSNLLIVAPGSATTTGGVRGGRGSASTLTLQDAASLASPVVAPDIARVAAVATSNQSLSYGTTNWTTSVVGTTPSWLPVRSRSLTAGRFLTQPDLDRGAQVVVLGTDTAGQLFGARNPVGQSVALDGSDYTVIGTLAPLGASASTSEDDVAVLPATTYRSRVATGATRSSASTIYLQAASPTTLTAAYQEADAALSTMHEVAAGGTPDFSISSQQALVQTATSTARTLTVLLAGISLLVGGIGVMNIMLVSVTERVREIGLRKALGATPAAVRRQFLVEASSLGLVGGVLGLGLAFAGSALLPRLLHQPVTIAPAAAVGAVLTALVIGVVAGVYPATRAARLAPIDALRSE